MAPLLLPLPGGGVAVYTPDRIEGLGPDGRRRWQLEDAPRPAAWALAGDRLVLAADFPDPVVYTLDAAGQLAGPVRPGGRPVALGQQVVLYRPDGLLAFDPRTLETRLLQALPESRLADGQALATPDGGLLLAHRGPRERELFHFGPDGALRWRRSLAELGSRLPTLAVTGNRAYALTPDGALYALDLARASAELVLAGGLDLPIAQTSRAFAAGDALLLDLRAGFVVALDDQTVARAPEADPPGS
jgi:hypothetical protein